MALGAGRRAARERVRSVAPHGPQRARRERRTIEARLGDGLELKAGVRKAAFSLRFRDRRTGRQERLTLGYHLHWARRGPPTRQGGAGPHRRPEGLGQSGARAPRYLIDVHPSKNWRNSGSLTGARLTEPTDESQTTPRPTLFVPTSSVRNFVLGNAAYVHVTPLQNSIADATGFCEKLTKLGFKPLTRSIKRVRLGYTVFFHYSGHGIQINGQNCIVPVDATLAVLHNDLKSPSAYKEWSTAFLQRMPPDAL